MRVLLTGAAGQVGRALRASAPAGVELCAYEHSQLDIGDGAAVYEAVQAFAPTVILNAAAYTAVDKAEAEPDRAAVINGEAPRYLAEAAAQLGNCRVMHISTDYVFDGMLSRAYRPQDATGPLSVYGRTKLAGEQAVLGTLGLKAVVLRTAWVYAADGKNFLLTMLRLMRERGVVRVVADQRGTPTAAHSIAQALWRIAERPGVHGVLHWTDEGATSWYEFAQAIARDAHALGLLPVLPKVEPIGTADYPTAAQRPRHSVLDCSEAVAQLALPLTPWQENLRRVLSSLASEPAG